MDEIRQIEILVVEDNPNDLVAERIRRAVQAMPSFVREAQSTTAVSIGIASFPEHGTDIDSVMEKADQAMYSSKKNGKNKVTVYSLA